MSTTIKNSGETKAPVSNVFLALQANEDTRPIIEAILADNELAKVDEQPAMVRIFSPGKLVINADTVSELMGREFDIQELHINIISLSGHVDEDDDILTLSWGQ